MGSKPRLSQDEADAGLERPNGAPRWRRRSHGQRFVGVREPGKDADVLVLQVGGPEAHFAGFGC